MMDHDFITLELSAIRDELREQKGTLQEVRDRVLQIRQCPQPGLCAALQTITTDMEKRLRTLERRDALIVGACVVITFFGTLLGPAIRKAMGL